VAGLRKRSVQVRKGEYFNQCVRNPDEQTQNFHVGKLRVEETLLALMVTKIIMPRGSNHP